MSHGAKAKRAWKAAELLCGLLKGKDKLPHCEAVRVIKDRFGEEFLYTNRNGNPAISGVFWGFSSCSPKTSWFGRNMAVTGGGGVTTTLRARGWSRT